MEPTSWNRGYVDAIDSKPARDPQSWPYMLGYHCGISDRTKGSENGQEAKQRRT